jgi:hypothetical protein
VRAILPARLGPEWKEMVPIAYVADRNAEVAGILGDPKKTETERFRDAFEVTKKAAKALHNSRDGHSRSKMGFYMITFRGQGMLKPEDLAGFSEDIQNRVFDDPFETKG